MRGAWLGALATFLLLAPLPARAQTLINFEDRADLESVTNQYAAGFGTVPGVSFTNARVLAKTGHLNDPRYPTHSGVKVLEDNGPRILGDFTTGGVRSFGAWFTWCTKLHIKAYSGVGQTGTQLVLNGIANELITTSSNNLGNSTQFVFTAPSEIRSFELYTESPSHSFTLDDFQATAVPEPGALALLSTALVPLWCLRRRTFGRR